MKRRITTWLWLLEYSIAEARAGHVAAGRHLRVALASVALVVLAALPSGR